MICPTLKKGYPGFVSATRAANSLIRFRYKGEDLVVYRCKECGDWHIGNKILDKKIYKRDRHPIEIMEE